MPAHVFAQTPAAQKPVQQAASWVQLSPSRPQLDVAAAQVEGPVGAALQLSVQQSASIAQPAPCAAQLLVHTMSLKEFRVQLPRQQSPSVMQRAPGGRQGPGPKSQRGG